MIQSTVAFFRRQDFVRSKIVDGLHILGCFKGPDVTVDTFAACASMIAFDLLGKIWKEQHNRSVTTKRFASCR